MKKLTLLITALFLGIGMAWAQQPKPVLELSAKQIGTEYPKQLDEVYAQKVYALDDLTIAVRINTNSVSGRMSLFATSDPTKAANTDAEGMNSRYVGLGMNGADCGYLASWRGGDRFTGGNGITSNTNDMVVTYVVNPSNRTFEVYLNGVKQYYKVNAHADGFMSGYEIATPGMVKNDHSNANIYIGGAKHSGGNGEVFNGAITGIQVYDGALTAQQIGAIQFNTPVEPEFVNVVSDFTNGTIYTFVTERGWMGAKADNDKVISTVYTSNGVTGRATDANFQWTVYKSGNDKYYLYNIGKGQFMGVESGNNTAVPFVETPAGTKLTFKESGSADYPIMFSTDNAAVVNHSGDHQYGLISWTGGWNDLNDGGSNHKVESVGILDETTLANIKKRVEAYEATAILDNKYYRIKAVDGWNDDAPYLGSKNSTANTLRAEYVANADAYTIFYLDENYQLKNYATGEYLVNNGGQIYYNSGATSGASFAFCEANNGLEKAYNISFNNGGRWLYVNKNNHTDAGSSRNNTNGYCFNIEEVTELPVAQGGNTVYYNLADAKANVKAGETLTLFVDTDETIELPLGVILDRNGHTADNVTVATPVAKIGDQGYATLAAAVAAVQNGETISLESDCDDSFTITQTSGKSFTVAGNGKTFTGTITINGKSRTTGAESLTFENVVFKAGNSIAGTSAPHNVTFNGCKFVTTSGYNVLPTNPYNWKFLDCSVEGTGAFFQASKSMTKNLYVENMVAENTGNLFKIDYCSTTGTTATFKNVVVKNGAVAFYISNRNSNGIVFENVDAECQYPVMMWDRGTGVKTPLEFVGENKFVSTAGNPWLTNGSAANVSATAQIAIENGNKVYGSLTAAVEDATAGQTIVLMSNTDETVMIPKGVKLEYNDFVAENVTFEFVAAAVIGDVEYESFDAAYSKAKTGDVIVLKKTAVITNSKPWVNYSKKNITVEAQFGDAAFRIQDGAYVWLGGMTINSNDYCVIVGAKDGSTGADVEIYGGTYNGATTAVSVTKGSVKIMDGTFKVEPYQENYNYTINCVDANYGNGSAEVAIQGGKFYNFNPGNNAAEGAGTNFLTAGKSAVQGEDGYYEVVDAEAKVNGVYYLTLEEAIAAAQDGDVVELCNNVEADQIITINKAITLNGWGRSLTSTAGRAINVDCAGEVTIKKLTINASGERAINVIQKPVNLTIDEVTATASNYTVNVAGTAANSVVAIMNSTLNGLCTVNVAAAGAQVTVDNSTVNCNDNNTTAGESYAALSLGKESVGGSIIATNSTINVVEGSDSFKGRNGAENGTVTINGSTEDVVVMVAVITYEGSDYYHAFPSIAAAVEFANEGATITLIRDAVGAGVVINKSITIDFNEKTYTVNEGVGSTGTQTNGFQILKENTVTLKNGTLNVAEDAADKFYILVQNYANLTVENMTLDGKYLDKYSATDGDSYVLSNNSGTVNVIGSTIKANDEGSLAFAMDACTKAPYGAPVVTVAEGSTINGNVEVSATLNMNGTLDGAIVLDKATGKVVTDKQYDIKTSVADHKVVNNGGVYTIVEMSYVAQVGEDKYETFAAAVAAAPAGGTVTLIADATETATVVLTKNLTIDGAGKTFTGAIEFEKSNGSFTVKNVKFNGAGTRVYALKSQASVTSLTVENCEATGYTYGFLYANKAVANAIVNNVTVKDVNYGVHSARGTNVTLTNFVAENVKTAVYVQNYSGRNVVLNNCSFTGSDNPLDIWERNETYKITFNFEGVNEMGKADFCTSTMAVINADAVAGTKVCETLAAAVAVAEAGDTITLLRNVQLDSYLAIEKSITLELGKYNITRDGGTALYVNGDVKVAINGTTGTITGSQALWVANGLAEVNGGNFCGVAEAVYVQNTGKAEIYGGTFSSSNYNSFVLNKKDDSRETASITVYGGTFVGFNPADNAAEGAGTNFVATGFVSNANEDGTYNVVVNPAYGKVAKVGDVYYATFAEAVAAAPAGSIITLVADAAETATVVLTKNLTIDGDGYTFTGAIEFKKANGSFTVKNVNFNGADTRLYALKSQASTTSLTVEECTATDYTYGFLYANKAIANLTVKNVTVKEVNYGVHSAYGTKVTLENYEATNVKYPVYVQNYGTRNVVLNNCSFTGCEYPLYVWERNQTNKITFNFEGVNEMGKADFCTSAMAVINADAVAGTKVCGTLAEAVAAAEAGDTITLLRNVQLDALLTINKSVTLDLGEYNITRDGRTAIYVEGDVEVTINGNGTVSGKQALYVGGGLVKVYGGNFHGLTEAVYVQHAGKAEIYGGTFSSDNVNFVLNEYDSTRDTSDIAVYGGTFVGFDPADNAAEGAGTNFVATGFVSNANEDGTYVVVKGLAGKGTEANPYIIKNLDELEFFKASVNAGETKYNAPGVWVALGADIDLDGTTWTEGIGDGHNWTFDGNFDGKGYAIKNLTIEPYADEAGYLCGGLFGYIYGGVTIQNLVIENATINCGEQEGHNVGILVGFANNNGGKANISNVTVKGDVKVDAANVYGVGAIVGYSYRAMGTIAKCSVEANDGSYIKGHSFVGGITGYSYTGAAIAECSVKNIAITATKYSVGGIAGIVLANNTISECAVENVTVNGEANVGNVVGAIAANGIVVENCTAAEPLVGGNYSDNKPVEARNGNKYYATLDAALVAEGDEVELLVPVTVAKGEERVIDLNGKTVSVVVAGQLTKSFAAITNKGTLTVMDSKANGKLTLSYGGESFGYGIGLYTISNEGGELNIESGIIENTATVGGSMYDAIDNNSTTGDAVLNISGGEVKCAYIGVRQFANSTTHDNIVNVTGGKVVGGNTSIWMQNPGSKQPKATIAISAGNIDGRLLAGESTGFNFEVTGGTFTTDVTAFCAEHYICQENGDGTYSVIRDPNYIDELTIVDGDYTEFENQNAKTVGTLTYKRDMKDYVGKWQPLFVPFEIPVSKLTELGYQVAIFYDVHFEPTGDGTVDLTSTPDLHILKITSGTLKANYPYVIKPSSNNPQLSIELSNAKLYSTAKSEMTSVESGSTITRFIFAGTYTKATPGVLTGDANIPCYAINKGGKFQKMGSGANLPAFRVYMSIVAKDGSHVILAENAAESISMRVIGEEAEDGTTIIYDVEMDEVESVDYIFDLQGRRVLEPQKGNLYIINGKKVVF